ncbi:glutaredoxin [Pseudofrancisella aestuarii]|uniref:Glutaredoxin n=1 Tax=Pseudofrancisella aestuarii TaxID=2670347 RepID=A0ABV9T9U3_9GAMM|nr:glutaredoxin [Pseudofrancisella aestuarii]
MKVKIYTTTSCPFCIGAKQWFNDNNISFDEIKLDNYQERVNFYDEMNKSGKVRKQIRTVPQIFINDEHIGGFDDLRANADSILKKK